MADNERRYTDKDLRKIIQRAMEIQKRKADESRDGSDLGTDKLTIKIMNKAGQLVKTLDLGDHKKGTVSFNWDGVIKKADPHVPGSKEEKAPPGVYKVVAQYMKDGKAAAANTFVVDKVDSVSLAKGGQGVTLNLNHTGATSLANVREIL